MFHRLPLILSLCLLCLGATSCSRNGTTEEVVVYCALDSVFSEPVLREFENRTGIRVRTKFDVEAAKTTGLTQALLAEREHPRCDVYWNNEIMQTLRLKSAGVLTSYRSPAADGIPAEWRDPEGHWTAIAARARILVYHPERVKADDLPRHLDELTQPEWKDRVVIAKPLFGTTATHVSTLYARWGPERARNWMKALKDNGVSLTDGNASVVRLVASGERDIGLTDTDDVFMALKAGQPIAWTYIGQDAETPGPLLIPNTIALIKDGPNPAAARKLVDYLLSPEVEQKLAESDSRQIPLHPDLNPPLGIPAFEAAPVDYEVAAGMMDTAFNDIKRDLL